MKEKFPDNFRVFREVWKNVVKKSSLEPSFKKLVRETYVAKKQENISLFCQYLEISLKNKKANMIDKVDKVKFSDDLDKIKQIFLENDPNDVVTIIDVLCVDFDQKI